MNNSIQSGDTTGNEAIKLERKRLEEEIGVLGIEHEKATKELNVAELRKKRIGENEVEFEKSEKKKKEWELVISDLKKKVKSFEVVLFSLEREHLEKVAKFNSDIDSKEEELNKTIQSRTDDLGAIEKRLADKTTQLEDKTTEYNDVKNKKGGLENDIVALKDDVADLEKTSEKVLELKVEESKLKRNNNSFEVLEISLRKKVSGYQTELLGISRKVAKEKKEANEFIKNGKETREKFDSDMVKERVEMDKREGVISEREGWLQEKTESVRKVITEVEKFHGKKITHIKL